MGRLRIGDRVVWGLVAILLSFLTLAPPPARAQYMYLDTNGDGINTEADVVQPSGVTNVDVWLRTNLNRDGAPAACPTADGSMTINSYEVIIRAEDGSVSWGALTNRMPFNIDLGTQAIDTDAHVGFGSGTPLAPGTYRVASVALTPTFGTPRLKIVTSSPLAGLWLTAFGSDCSGNDFDNTLKLGSDWFDIDGASWGGAPNHLPVFAPIPMIAAAEGEVTTQPITATDADGEAIQFGKSSGPSYVTVATTDAAAGTGSLTAAPGFLDAGVDSAVIYATDGLGTTLAPIIIQVADRPAPPELSAVGNMRVLAGGTAEQYINAFDADGEAGGIAFELFGPSFFTVTTLSPLSATSAQGLIRVTPSISDVGSATATVSAVKGTLRDDAVFRVDVLASAPANRPCVISDIVDVTMAAGTTRNVEFSVVDPDGDVMSARLASGQSFAAVEILTSSPGALSGRIVLRPQAGDVGDYTITIAAFDGIAEAQSSFAAHVLGSSAPRFTVLQDMVVGADLVATQTIRATSLDPDAFNLTFSKVSGPAYVSVQTQNSFPTNAYAEVTLRPGPTDAGSATAQIAVTDGVQTTIAPMQITVQPPCPVWLAGRIFEVEGVFQSLLGDVDGDHVPDVLAFTNRTVDVSVRLGNGDATFRPAASVPNAAGLAVASLLVDLNADARADLVTAGSVNAGVIVRLAQGGGAFGEPLATPIVGYPHDPEALAAADMNGDGHIDLVVGEGGPNLEVRVLLGAGDGTFTLAGSVAISSPLMTLTTSDVDRDGATDVIVGQYYSTTLLVIHGNGAGGFGATDAYPNIGFAAHSVAAGDLNGDSWPDIVLAHDNLSVWFNDGAGRFLPLWRSPAPYRFWSVAVGDVTGDGQADVVATGEEWFDQVRGAALVFAGADAESLAAPTGTIFDRHVVGAALGDLDRDGRPDLLATGQDAVLGFLDLGCGSAVDQAPRLLLAADRPAAEADSFAIRVYAADPDAEPIASLTAGTLPLGASFGAASDARSGRFSWTPGYEQAGEYDVTFYASNAMTGSVSAHIQVANTDRAPTVAAPSAKVVCAGAELSFTVTAADPDGDALSSLTATPLPPGATFQAAPDHASGEFRWTTAAGSVGTYDIEFRAGNDGIFGSAHTQIVVGAGTACLIPFELEDPDTTTLAGAQSALELDALGTPHIAYTVGSGSLRYARKGTSGWVIETVPVSGNPYSVDLALDSSGEPWIAFESQEAIDFYIYFRAKVAHRSGGVWVVETVGAISPISSNIAIEFDHGGAPHVVYFGLDPYGVNYASRSGSAWSSESVYGAGEQIAGLEFDSGGTPHVIASYASTILHAMRGAGGWTYEFGPRGSPMSFALDVEDQPHVISIRSDGYPSTWEYLQRESDGVWHTEEIGPMAGFNTPRPSLRLNRDGRPLVAMPDLVQGILNLLRKPGESWITHIVDAGGIGRSVSLELADGGNPRISYSDPAGGLRYAAGDIPPNLPPLASAGGPYVGTVGQAVAFDGSGSTDPDGGALTHSWDFGDGAQGSGERVEHVYAAAGGYGITLTVSDGELTGTAATTATITETLSARAFVLGAQRTVPMVNPAQPFLCVQVEPLEGSFAAEDMIVSSIVMRSDSTGSVGEIGVREGKGGVIADRDHNGVAEVSVCFAREDLGSLFASVTRQTTVEAVIEGALRSGARVRAPIQLKIIPANALAARIYPNPLNPAGRLSLVLPRAGRLRVVLFDVAGRAVRVLADVPRANAGLREIDFDGNDGRGRSLATGIYFYRIESAGNVMNGRIAIAK